MGKLYSLCKGFKQINEIPGKSKHTKDQVGRRLHYPHSSYSPNSVASLTEPPGWGGVAWGGWGGLAVWQVAYATEDKVTWLHSQSHLDLASGTAAMMPAQHQALAAKFDSWFANEVGRAGLPQDSICPRFHEF